MKEKDENMKIDMKMPFLANFKFKAIIKTKT